MTLLRMPARAAATLAGYAALVVWLTWPLTAQITTSLPATRFGCHFDQLYTGWVLAWETHALATAPTSLLDANIYHPASHTLFYSLTAFGVLPYFAPTFAATGNPTLALNLVFLGGIVLTASVLHATVAAWTGSQLGGVVAASAYLANRWVLWEWVPTAPQNAVLQYVPAIIAVAAVAGRRPCRLLLLLTLVVLQCLTDVTYVAPAIFAPLAVLALARVARASARPAGLALLGVLGLAAIALAPVCAGHLAIARREPALRQQTHFPARPLDETIEPLAVFGSLAPADVPTPALFLVVLGLLWRLVAARRARHGASRASARLPSAPWLHAGLWAAVGIVITLPPLASWHGHVMALPQYVIAAHVPLYRFIRPPSRLGMGALMGLALLAGIAFAEIARRRRASARLALAVTIVLALYGAYARGADPVFPRPPLPAFYPLLQPRASGSLLTELLRRTHGPVLELPVDPPHALMVHAGAMYGSIFHWRPLLNGYGSYWPSAFPEHMAEAEALPDPEALAALVRETGLRTIVLHGGLAAPQRSRWEAIAAGTAPGGLALLGRAGSDLVFTVR